MLYPLSYEGGETIVWALSRANPVHSGPSDYCCRKADGGYGRRLVELARSSLKSVWRFRRDQHGNTIKP